MESEIERARHLFKALELRNSNKMENALRLLCIQELLEDTREQIKVRIKSR